MKHGSNPALGKLLKRLRVEAGLSQELLAERSGISVDAISRNERGLKGAPRRETIALLIEALQPSSESRLELERAAKLKRLPELESAERPVDNFPWQPTRFIGRNREVEELSGLLAPRTLVTVTGAGGIGKTRLSLEITSQRPRPPDGAWFVDLAPLLEPNRIVGKIASILGIRVPEAEMLPALTGALKGRDLLLILDNCEHVIEPMRSVARAILDACPKVTLLATSRERIGIAGERVYQLSTLPLPVALELFADRAALAQHNFDLSDAQVDEATDVCRRLDGIALAIELAAARLPALGLTGLRGQLDQHFGVIAGARPDLPERQQTLYSTIAWSHDLLNAPERMLFRRLAIFANGWTLAAAQSVCSEDALTPALTLRVLVSLVEKSLVMIDTETAIPRYSFFESTRAYALEQLQIGGERAMVARQHAHWMATFADRAYDTYLNGPRRLWERSLAAERDNILAALDWAFGPNGDALLGCRIAGGVRGLWLTTGFALYGRRYIGIALENVDPEQHPEIAARLLLAQFQYLKGTENIAAMTRAIALLEGTNDRRMLELAYGSLSFSLLQSGRFDGAQDASDKAFAIMHESGRGRSSFEAVLLGDRSILFRMQGRFDEAKATLSEAISIARDLDDDWTLSNHQTVLAEFEFDAGDVEGALALGKDALASARRVRGAIQEYCTLCNLSAYLLILGELDEAEAHAKEAIALARNANAQIVYNALQHLATIAALRGDAARAAIVLGHVDAWYLRSGCVRELTEMRTREMLADALRTRLSPREIANLATQGAHLNEEAAVAMAASN